LFGDQVRESLTLAVFDGHAENGYYVSEFAVRAVVCVGTTERLFQTERDNGNDSQKEVGFPVMRFDWSRVGVTVYEPCRRNGWFALMTLILDVGLGIVAGLRASD